MKCSNCGETLIPSGGQTGWRFKAIKGRFCAKCAAKILYPTSLEDFAVFRKWMKVLGVKREV